MTKAPKRVLVIALLVTVLFGMQIPTSRWTVDPAAHANPNGLRVGIAHGNRLLVMPDDVLATVLDDAVEVGAGWIRLDLSWADLQADNDRAYKWYKFDRVVAAALSRGLRLLPIIAFTPGWARVSGCDDEKCAPEDPAEFARFAGEAASRYPEITTWEIWNEENFAMFWQPHPDAGAYAQLLRATVASIGQANPAAQVLVGGLANVDASQGGVAPAEYLAELVRAGAMDGVDGVGLHYPDIDTLQSMRGILADAGMPGLPIWITEDGAPTGGVGVTDAVTEDEQAERVSWLFEMATANPDIAAVVWYTNKDFDADLNDTESHYGLRRADGSKKPAYDAFQQAVAEFRH